MRSRCHVTHKKNMCLFPRKNKNENGKAYQKGITEYNCGCCPECLSAKSRYWALRCSMEAKVSQGMMVTLTYDTYKYDEHGNIIGENDPNTHIRVDKRDAQNFIKRLRYYFPNNTIKYLLTAEYGKRTGRAHYHALIFGVQFDDLRFYKKSKRGNIIYKSKTLEKIWQGGKLKKGGICTVDCVNISAKVARYCTKYCAKDSGVDDTFMLFSQGIGESVLRKRFTGKPYILDGTMYPIPKTVWKWYITNKYKDFINQRYPKHNKKVDFNISAYANFDDNSVKYFRSKTRNELYYSLRDEDILYKRYIQNYQRLNETLNKYKKSNFDRILDLDPVKYFSYKQACLRAINHIGEKRVIIPRASWKVNLTYNREYLKSIGLTDRNGKTLEERWSVAVQSRHNTATDSKKAKTNPYGPEYYKEYICHSTKTDMYLRYSDWKIGEVNPFLQEN